MYTDTQNHSIYSSIILAPSVMIIDDGFVWFKISFSQIIFVNVYICHAHTACPVKTLSVAIGQVKSVLIWQVIIILFLTITLGDASLIWTHDLFLLKPSLVVCQMNINCVASWKSLRSGVTNLQCNEICWYCRAFDVSSAWSKSAKHSSTLVSDCMEDWIDAVQRWFPFI